MTHLKDYFQNLITLVPHTQKQNPLKEIINVQNAEMYYLDSSKVLDQVLMLLYLMDILQVSCKTEEYFINSLTEEQISRVDVHFTSSIPTVL